MAPQAQLEESANDRGKPEVPIIRELREFQRLFWEPVLRLFASGICVFRVRNKDPADLQIGQNVSVCLSVCLYHFFCRRFLKPVDRAEQCKYAKKNGSKRGSRVLSGRELDHFWDPP